MKHTELEKKNSKLSDSSPKNRTLLVGLTSPRLRYVVCINSGGCVDLQPLKVYRVRYDKSAVTAGMLRIIDESDEDYLYPAKYFKPIHASSKLFQALIRE